MRNTRILILFLLLHPGIFPLVYCDTLEIKSIGSAFISNYSPKIYKSERQNWDIAIGKNGLIYFANGNLMACGNNYWQVYSTTGGKLLRSVYSLDNGKILVGGLGDVGIFEPTNLPGELVYKSLMNTVDSSFLSFGAIWQIIENKGRCYLRAGHGLFEYKNDSIIPVLFGNLFDFMESAGETLFLSISEKGLGVLKENAFILIPGGDFFAQRKIKGVFTLQDSSIVVFTDDNGAFLIKNGKLSSYKPDKFISIITKQISAVTMLNKKYFAIGTVKDGVYITDISGNIIQHINKANGLQNNTIISMRADRMNNLWLGLDNGVSYLELNSCLSILNSETDIGMGYVSKYHNGKLYLGTNQGLFATKWDNKISSNNHILNIQPIRNTSGQVWSLFTVAGKLYCGHHKGIYLIENDVAKLIDQTEGCWKLDPVIGMPGYFLESSYRGFFLFDLDGNNTLNKVKKLNNAPRNSRMFIQDERGYIWTINTNNVLCSFRINPSKLEMEGLKEYHNYRGLPIFNEIQLVGDSKHVFISTDSGLYSYNHVADIFENASIYDQIIGGNSQLYEFFEDGHNRIWYVKDGEIGYLSLHFNKPEKVYLPFTKLLDNYTFYFGSINVIDKDNILFSVDQGFYHYTSSCPDSEEETYNTFITSFTSVSGPVEWKYNKQSKKEIPCYAHKKNSFVISFTTDIFSDANNVFYKYKLEGQDEEWSEWTTRNSKEYNNVFEGTYNFKVITRNKYGYETSEANFAFMVVPPFYRSILAYLLYVAIIIGLLMVFRHFRIRKIESERRKIEEKKHQEIREKKKKFEEEQLIAKQHIAALTTEKLEESLIHKTKELANSTINILRKNEILQGLKAEMQQLYMEKDLKKRDSKIYSLIRLIDSEINTNKDWEIFDTNFNALHEDFINKMRHSFPSLNHNDIRLCTFLKMNKSTKEIATLMNMSIRGVETSRYRLRKKMNIPRDENLYELIQNV